jgi:hypothetical protein
MGKQTLDVRAASKLVQDEIGKEAARFPAKTARVHDMDYDTSLEVNYAFGINGTVQVCLRFNGETYAPKVETSFPSAHRSGMTMVAFSQLVVDLTGIATRLQVILDTFEIVPVSKT